MVFGIDLPEMKMPDMPGMDLVPGVEKKKEKDPPGEALTPVLENAIKFCSTNGATPLSAHNAQQCVPTRRCRKGHFHGASVGEGHPRGAKEC
jgi:hypothetical protein